MNRLYVKMIGMFFFILFCGGRMQAQFKMMPMPAANGQALSALTEEVIEGWRPFSITKDDDFDAILKHKAEIEKNILSKDTKDKSAAFANAVWAMREAVFYYRDNQSAEVNRKGIQKLLKGMNLKDFTTLHSFEFNVDAYYNAKALAVGITPAQVFGDKKDDLQYKRWKEMLETRDSLMIVNYFGAIRNEFIFKGYTDVLKKLRPLFERYMPEGELKTQVKDLYELKERLEPVRYIVEIAKQAMAELGIKPLIVPIRGGTNGSKLSFMGLPTPNLSNGAHNGHGRYEYIPVSSMEKIVNVIVKISELCAKM